jgi:hypothetical protein
MAIAGLLLCGIVSVVSFNFGRNTAVNDRLAGQQDGGGGHSISRSSRENADPTASADERKAARMAIKATNDMREMGLLAAKKGITYSLVAANGQVTGQSLDMAGIPRRRSAEVQELIDSLWKDVSNELSKRVEPDAKLSDASRGVAAFKIPSDKIYADARLFQFKQDLQRRFGNKEGEILFDGLGSTNQFGGFGKQDLSVKFIDAPYSDGRIVRQVEFCGRDPETGREITGGKFVAETYLYQYFGTVFDAVLGRN